MAIDRTKIDIGFYVEINNIDCSDFIISNGNFVPNSKKKISYGRFVLDDSFIFTPKKFQTVYFYVEKDSKYKRFGGVISDVSYDKEEHSYTIDCKSFAWLLYNTKFTGIFRADSGKGNRKTIITDILTEKFPNITWDLTSFPDISSDYDILYRIYNSNTCGIIFDELTSDIDRDWWIDENGKFFCKDMDYIEVNQPLSIGVNIGTFPIIEINNNYANIVKVLGAKFEKTITNTFSGTGSADEFDLDFYPGGSSDVYYDDDTVISVTMEGNENYDDSSVYDAYFKVSDKKLKFNVNTTIGTNNIIVKTIVYDQISEELPSPSEIERIGYEVVKEINNENIATQEEAYNIAKSYLDNYGNDQYLFVVDSIIRTDSDLENWKIGNSVPINLGDGEEYKNIIEEYWYWTNSSPISLRLRFTDFQKTDDDILQELINKISREENKISNSKTNITKYFYLGNNIIVAFQNISMQTQEYDGRFEMQEHDFDDRSLMSETGTIPGGTAYIMREYDDYSGTISTEFSSNLNNKFQERFINDWFIHSSSGGTLNNGSYELGNNEILLSKAIAKEYDKSFNFFEIDITGTLSNCTIYSSVDGGLTFTEVSENILYSYSNGTTDGVLYKIVAGAGGSGNISQVDILTY